MKKMSFSLVILLIFSFLAFGKSKPAPYFQLKDINGKVVKLTDLKGKPVVIIFWSTVCPKCRKELPEISKKLVPKYKNVQFIGIVTNTKDIKEIKETIKRWGINFPVLIADKKVKIKYGFRGTPMFYFLDKDLNVKAIIYGARKLKTYEKLIKKIGGGN